MGGGFCAVNVVCHDVALAILAIVVVVIAEIHPVVCSSRRKLLTATFRRLAQPDLFVQTLLIIRMFPLLHLFLRKTRRFIAFEIKGLH